MYLINREKELKKEFKLHLKNSHLQNWVKVTKRFFTIAAKLKSDKFVPHAIRLFKKNPLIRGHITYYLSSLGYGYTTKRAVLQLLNEVNVYDDVTLFHLSKLLTDWTILKNKHGTKFVNQVLKIFAKPKSVFEFYCCLWISAKYAKPSDLLSIIVSSKPLWSQEPFLTRQVVAVLPRIRPFKPEKVTEILEEQISIGPEDAASVAHNIKELETVDSLSKKLKPYLFPENKQIIYPLPKFLILCSVLESPQIKNDHGIRDKVKEYITDPWMKFWLDEYTYNRFVEK